MGLFCTTIIYLLLIRSSEVNLTCYPSHLNHPICHIQYKNWQNPDVKKRGVVKTIPPTAHRTAKLFVDYCCTKY